MKRRVVVTGLGAVTPIGNDVESFWNGLKEKKVGIAPITAFDTTEYKAKLAAEVKDFDPKACMDPKQLRDWKSESPSGSDDDQQYGSRKRSHPVWFKG